MTRRRHPVRPPTATAGRLVELAVRRLPAGEVRTRYEREFIAELYGLPAHRQLRHSLGVLLTVTALRRAVTAQAPTRGETLMPVTRPRTPLRCRLNISHRWVRRSTEDGQRFVVCARCGKDKHATAGPQAAVPF